MLCDFCFCVRVFPTRHVVVLITNKFNNRPIPGRAQVYVYLRGPAGYVLDATMQAPDLFRLQVRQVETKCGREIGGATRVLPLNTTTVTAIRCLGLCRFVIATLAGRWGDFSDAGRWIWHCGGHRRRVHCRIAVFQQYRLWDEPAGLCVCAPVLHLGACGPENPRLQYKREVRRLPWVPRLAFAGWVVPCLFTRTSNGSPVRWLARLALKLFLSAFP